ncbi:hypothetical protein QJS66_18645 [Kocuria rhizophila]|nr:hypothetical protein QJS66_18645 [Kocuria rhizophila]
MVAQHLARGRGGPRGSSLVFRVPVLTWFDPAHRYYATVTRGNQT